MEGEKTYITGFNHGFKLAEFQPELWEKLKPSLSSENEYERGVMEGAAEYEKEKEKEREADLEAIRASKEQGKDRDLTDD